MKQKAQPQKLLTQQSYSLPSYTSWFEIFGLVSAIAFPSANKLCPAWETTARSCSHRDWECLEPNLWDMNLWDKYQALTSKVIQKPKADEVAHLHTLREASLGRAISGLSTTAVDLLFHLSSIQILKDFFPSISSCTLFCLPQRCLPLRQTVKPWAC